MNSILSRAFTLLAAIAILSAGAALVAPQYSHAKIKTKCTKFQPGDLNVIFANGGYIVAEGNNWILEFGADRAEARLSVHVIQHYGMNKICEVNPPDTAMNYFLVGGAAPKGAIVGEDCIGFKTKRVEYKLIGNEYFLVEGSRRLLPLGPDRDAARRARKTIRNSGFRNICYIGRPDPSMTYFRK